MKMFTDGRTDGRQAHRYIPQTFRSGDKNDTVDTIFKLKTSKGIILLKFRCIHIVMIIVLCKFSDHAFNLYKVS